MQIIVQHSIIEDDIILSHRYGWAVSMLSQASRRYYEVGRQEWTPRNHVLSD